MHGACHIDETIKTPNPRWILAINLWNKAPLHVPYFSYESFAYVLFAKTKLPITFVHVENDDPILDIRVCNKTVREIMISDDVCLATDIIRPLIIDNNSTPLCELLKTRYSEVISAFFDITILKTKLDKIEIDPGSTDLHFLDMSTRKFQQRFIRRSLYQPEVCNWLVYEFSKSRAKQKGYMSLESNQCLLNFAIISFSGLVDEILQSYSMGDSVSINIDDMRILTYPLMTDSSDVTRDTNDDADMVLFISLNDVDNSNCNFTFDDGLSPIINKGDVLAFSATQKTVISPPLHGQRIFLRANIKFLCKTTTETDKSV